MGLLDRTKALLGNEEADTGTYEYRCRDCESVFESGQPRLANVECPDCGSGDIRDHVV